MTALRDLLCFVPAATALALPFAAYSQAPASSNSAWQAGWYPSPRSSLGLHLGRSQSGLPCGNTVLICDAADQSTQIQASAMVGKFWGVEMGYAESGRLAATEGRAQGLNLSLVGKAPLGQSLGVFGKLGTTYAARSDTSILGAGPAPGPGPAVGLSYGAGVRFAFTPRLSATLEWDSNDFRIPGSGREPVRSTSLGLQYRY
jgi:OOP family OmpA-OmpF porin